MQKKFKNFDFKKSGKKKRKKEVEEGGGGGRRLCERFVYVNSKRNN